MASNPPTTPENVSNAATGGAVPAEGTRLGPQTCIICGDDVQLHCSVCRAAYYCSPECLETDKSAHDILCRNDPAHSPESTKNRTVVRALYFRQGAPRFVSIHRTPITNLTLEIFVGKEPDTQYIDYNAVRNRALHLSIRCYIQTQGIPLSSDCSEDKTLRNIMHQWMRWEDIGVDDNRKILRAKILLVAETANHSVRDLTYKDCQHIVDFLSVSTGTHSSIPAVWAERARKIRGVRVRCCGVQEIQFEILNCPQDHPKLKFVGPGYLPHNYQFSLFDMIGLPLIGWETSFHRTSKACADSRCIPYSAAYVHRWIATILDATPDTSDIFSRKRLDINFFRADGRDLDIVHMSALWNFIQTELLQAQLDGVHLMKIVTRANFERFWTESFPHGDAVNPYEVV